MNEILELLRSLLEGAAAFEPQFDGAGYGSGPDQWVCPACQVRIPVHYVQGTLTDITMADLPHHDDCLWRITQHLGALGVDGFLHPRPEDQVSDFDIAIRIGVERCSFATWQHISKLLGEDASHQVYSPERPYLDEMDATVTDLRHYREVLQTILRQRGEHDGYLYAVRQGIATHMQRINMARDETALLTLATQMAPKALADLVKAGGDLQEEVMLLYNEGWIVGYQHGADEIEGVHRNMGQQH